VTVLERIPLPAGGARPDSPGRRRRLPGPLVVLVIVGVVEALAWICVMPPLQGADEVGHFAYTQKIVEARTIPWRVGGAAPGGEPYSTEVFGALATAGILSSWGNPTGRPAGTSVDERMWDRLEQRYDHADRADGGFTSAMRNPPVYYVYEAVPYLATSWASLFDRAFAMRLANLPLLAIVLVFCWLIAGELLGGRLWLQTLATAAVALQPQLIHLTATVNPDIALAAIWCPALWLMIRIVRAGPARARVVWLLVLVGLSSLTQPRGVALVLPAATALAIAWGRRRPSATPRARWAVRGGLAALYVATLVALANYAVAGVPELRRFRQAASYLWQFYLPRLSFMTPVEPHWGVRQAFIDRLFGGYAQLEVSPPAWALTAVAVVAGALAASVIVGAVVRWRSGSRPTGVFAVLAVAVAGYLLLLHAAAARSLLSTTDPIITGRYLLPLIPLYGAGIAFAVGWLPRRVAAGAGAVVLAGLAVLQVASLAMVYARFYA
jgi:4-amino-4-deoxy-L-arabinose transferase-like glycosyltransferase